jgi:catechol 2,3-dioxygenase-like lactoylglutathione lyase family enzyme
MIKGLHHAGISVKNLDRSIEFYCGILGMELLRQGEFNGGTMDRITGLMNTRGRAAMLRAGGQHLELFEFALPLPKQADARRPVCDHGISHFCIEVTSIEQEFERLTAAGVGFHCSPQAFGKMKATYARDPDGNVVELLEIPG